MSTALESLGLDHGPISTHNKMVVLGWTPYPRRHSHAFYRRGSVRAEPQKKPRAAHHRFVYLAPNACWQLDATKYVLTGGA